MSVYRSFTWGIGRRSVSICSVDRANWSTDSGSRRERTAVCERFLMEKTVVVADWGSVTATWRSTHDNDVSWARYDVNVVEMGDQRT